MGNERGGLSLEFFFIEDFLSKKFWVRKFFEKEGGVIFKGGLSVVIYPDSVSGYGFFVIMAFFCAEIPKYFLHFCSFSLGVPFLVVEVDGAGHSHSNRTELDLVQTIKKRSFFTIVTTFDRKGPF